MSQMKRASTAFDLGLLPAGTVVIGPEFHSEVYQSVGAGTWYVTGSEHPYTPEDMEPRGPFAIIWEPESSDLSTGEKP